MDQNLTLYIPHTIHSTLNRGMRIICGRRIFSANYSDIFRSESWMSTESAPSFPEKFSELQFLTSHAEQGHCSLLSFSHIIGPDH